MDVFQFAGGYSYCRNFSASDDYNKRGFIMTDHGIVGTTISNNPIRGESTCLCIIIGDAMYRELYTAIYRPSTLMKKANDFAQRAARSATEANKKPMVMVNGRIVPKWETEPLNTGDDYFLVDQLRDEGYICARWAGGVFELDRLKNGAVFKSESDIKQFVAATRDIRDVES